MEAPTDFVLDVVLEHKLVDLWAEYPCLYGVSSPEFKNRDRRDAAIKEIGTKLEKSADWVKKKLQNLRNSYTKAKKPQSSGSARKRLGKRSVWLLKKLEFLAPYVATRKSLSNINLYSPKDEKSSTNDGDDETPLLIEDDEESLSQDGQKSPKATSPPDNDMTTESKMKSTNEPLGEKRKISAKKEQIKKTI